MESTRIFSPQNATVLSIYTECPGGHVPDFGRLFLKLKYTYLTKNTYI